MYWKISGTEKERKMKLMKSNSVTRFRKFSVLDPEAKDEIIGFITVVTEPITLEDRDFIAGVSFCSTEDLPDYNRNYGRTIAYNRMNNSRSVLRFTVGTERTLVDTLKEEVIQYAYMKGVKWLWNSCPDDLV